MQDSLSSALRFGSLEYLNYYLILIVFSLFFIYSNRRFQKKMSAVFSPKISSWILRSVSYKKKNIKFSIQMIGVSFIILAMLRPQMGQSQQEIKSEGIEILILADVSDSMLADDIKPNRLTQMKIELERLIDLMPGNKIGLIAFAGSSALMSPLTSDPGALKMYIQALDTYSVTTQGTNFEIGLSYAKEAFEKGGISQSDDQNSTRVVLVVSDGEDQEPGAREAAKKLQESGIHILTVAFGTDKGATIPDRDRFGSYIGIKKDSSGAPVITKVKGDFLQKLAEAGNGQFYFSSLGSDYLKNIVKDIEKYEKAQFASQMFIQYDEKFYWPLSLGILLLVFGFFITEGQKKQDDWKGKYDY